MATLECGNHPKGRPLTSTVTLKQSVEITHLKILTLMTQRKRGREERVQESAMIRNSKAFDPQRSADNTAHVSNEPWNPVKPLEATPKVTYCRWGRPLAAFAHILTLPKWYLATFKLITNRWAWELVPKRLAGCQMPSCRGGIHGNPGTLEPPNQNPSPGAWRKEEPRTGVTWYLRSPTCSQAPVSENHGKTTTYLQRLTRASPRPRNKML